MPPLNFSKFSLYLSFLFLSSAILEFMADHHYTAAVKRLGIPDKIIEHGEQSELHSESGFDVEGIEKAVLAMLETVLK